MMRDPSRIPIILEAIEKLWTQYPDWRLGQLVCNLAAWIDTAPGKVWDIEDDDLLSQVELHLQQRGVLTPDD